MDQYRSFMEAYLSQHCFLNPDEPQQKLFEAMRYSLLAGANACVRCWFWSFAGCAGETGRRRLPLPPLWRWVHTYSLIHDDLPLYGQRRLPPGTPDQS